MISSASIQSAYTESIASIQVVHVLAVAIEVEGGGDRKHLVLGGNVYSVWGSVLHIKH